MLTTSGISRQTSIAFRAGKVFKVRSTGTKGKDYGATHLENLPPFL